MAEKAADKSDDVGKIEENRGKSREIEEIEGNRGKSRNWRISRDSRPLIESRHEIDERADRANKNREARGCRVCRR